ncbi:MAG: dephospho-CoA kinase [Proteobacteria bacterium]|nr:dephospho-CoA kinase [Pseudomonadota bacterium]NOG60105.1 dephospho-CoA kinase [Pseudomonadota bacterium]
MSAVLRIALTGGIGSGKSTVSSMFHQLGVPIIDSDIISRDIVKPDRPCLNEIIHEFGNELLTKSGTLNRQKLRSIIFHDDSAKKKLEEILHPVIYQEIENQVSRLNYPYCLIVIPLLIETRAMERFDKILVVDAPETIQIERAHHRDNTSEKNIEKILKSQISRKQRLKYADFVIENKLGINELNNSVVKLHEKFLELSSYYKEKNE